MKVRQFHRDRDEQAWYVCVLRFYKDISTADIVAFKGCQFRDGTYDYAVLYNNGAYFGKVARWALASFGQLQVLDLAARTLIKCRKGLAQRSHSPAELHALRLRVKRCRYALEPICSTRMRRGVGKVLRCLALMQTVLGAHRDTVLALRWLEQQAPALGLVTVRALAERLREGELQALAALGLVPA